MAKGRVRKRNMYAGGEYLGRKLYVSTQYSTPLYTFAHTCTDQTNPGPPYRSGGPLTVKKVTVKVGTTSKVYCNKISTPKLGYDGRFYAAVPIQSPEPAAKSISGYGAIGWNRTLPVRPVASLGQAIGELKDFPGMIKQTAEFFKRLGRTPLSKGKTLGDFKRDIANGPSNLGSDYLNLQFGWVPFVSDLLSIINARQNLDRKLSQLRRDNGKGVRRSANLGSGGYNSGSVGGSTFSSVIPTVESQLYALGNTPLNAGHSTQSYQYNIWYSAKYTYWLPDGMLDPRRETAFLGLTGLERRLLGLELNASVIYNLMPWTWMLDWFSNAGSVVDNLVLNQQYHVVARYAYVMCHETYTFTNYGTTSMRTGTWGATSSARPVRVHALSSVKYEFKSREVAHPYGFGTTDADLNPFQWSILAALGLSRLR